VEFLVLNPASHILSMDSSSIPIPSSSIIITICLPDIFTVIFTLPLLSIASKAFCTMLIIALENLILFIYIFCFATIFVSDMVFILMGS
jgi:hypothetical protein